MQWFKIELLGNLILSEKTATAGDHRSLDYIPATAIQGVIASRAYQKMSKAEADQLVLLQGAQISDALPMMGDEVGLPVPLAWHTDKAKIINDAFIPSKLAKEELAGSQPQQIRSGYVTPSNIHFKPKMERHTKTAIDPNTGTVATGQLFNYQSIARGQHYLFAIDSTPELTKKIKALVEGKAAIGRSRSAEFGSVRITACPAPKLPSCANSNTLLLLSDTQVIDAYGQPSANPNHLGFGDIDLSQSYLRTRSRTRFNQFFSSYLADEQLIQAGSCLAVSQEMKLAPGLHWLNGCFILAGCDWLAKNKHVLNTAEVVKQAKPKVVDSNLTKLLKQRLQPLSNKEEALGCAEKLYMGYVELLLKAEGYLGQLNDNVPGKSQFGELRHWAQDGKKFNEIEQQLLSTQDKKNAWGWQLPVTPNQTLVQGFIELLKSIPSDQFIQTVERFAQKCSRKSLAQMLTDAQTKKAKEAANV